MKQKKADDPADVVAIAVINALKHYPTKQEMKEAFRHVEVQMDGMKKELRGEMQENTAKILQAVEVLGKELKTSQENHEERISKLEEAVLPRRN